MFPMSTYSYLAMGMLDKSYLMKDQSNTTESDKERAKELKRIAKEKKAEFEIREIERKEALSKIKEQKSIEKSRIESVNANGRFGTIGEPRKSLSTFFRNQNKLDISLVSILDRKASILIKISSTIISALVVFNDFIESNVVNGKWIAATLLVGLMITLVLAILATKPFVSKIRNIIKNEIKPKYPHLEQNLFAGSQLDCSLEEYEIAMEKLIHSQDLHIGNQIRASYMIGQSNRFKSKLVDMAFNVFLSSFVVVGIIYMVSKFI